jgi:hypothetical protein
MGWLKKRMQEPSTLAGLGTVAAIAVPLLPPHWQLIVQGIAGALGVGAVVRPEAGAR